MAAKHDEIDAWGSKLYKEKFAALLSREENLTSLERQKGMWAQEKIGLTAQLNALQEMKKSLEVKLEEAQKGQTGVLAAVESFDESSISYTNLQPELDALKCEHDTLKIEYEYLKKNMNKIEKESAQTTADKIRYRDERDEARTLLFERDREKKSSCRDSDQSTWAASKRSQGEVWNRDGDREQNSTATYRRRKDGGLLKQRWQLDDKS